ncbi:MAG TPA: fumarylacetoacetate hydrolase family protein [Candidatus Dormibacteraeota bacterium]|nr:fumarylacetoacetate hydrolase family protein [Candidatus Dormibacteraeota bacterium]
MEELVRLDEGLYVRAGAAWRRLPLSLDALLTLSVEEIRRRVQAAEPVDPPRNTTPRAPIESQEVWAAGVTYQRSLTARAEEAVSADPYERVYTAERPELFFKATAARVRAGGEAISIRSDSTWDAPEPELAVVCNSRLEVVGYTIGNDVSSRSIEGENPLYLPQAKVYDGCCALGPAIGLAWDYVPDGRKISLEIRRAGVAIFSGETSTSAMKRTIRDLLNHLGRNQTFGSGCILLTGTGIVPPADVTLRDGDIVSIGIEGLGELVNPVMRHPGRTP